MFNINLVTQFIFILIQYIIFYFILFIFSAVYCMKLDSRVILF